MSLQVGIRACSRLLGAALALAAFETTASAQISVQPAQINFGTVLVGNQSTPQNITIQNLGGAPVTIQAITLAGANPNEFKLGIVGQFTLAAGEAKVVTVYYAPVGEGVHNASLIVTPVGSPAFQVPLSGTAVLPVLLISTGQQPSNVLDFDQIAGPYLVGRDSDAQLVGLKVPSRGVAVSLDRITVAPDTDFRVTAPEKVDLSPGAQTTFRVTFRPIVAGPRAAVASVYVKGLATPLVSATFKGTGVGAPPGPTDLSSPVTAGGDLSVSGLPTPAASGCALGGHAPSPSGLLPIALLAGFLLLRRASLRPASVALALLLAACSGGGGSDLPDLSITGSISCDATTTSEPLCYLRTWSGTLDVNELKTTCMDFYKGHIVDHCDVSKALWGCRVTAKAPSTIITNYYWYAGAFGPSVMNFCKQLEGEFFTL